MSHLSTSLALVLCTACLHSNLCAEDWPQWRGPSRTGHVSEGSRVPSTLPSEPKLIWRLGIGGGLASPVIAGGRVFYFDNQDKKETLHAVAAKDARELWRAAVDDAFSDEQGPSGPRCTPLVDEDRVYAQSGKGELRCLRVADGTCLWHVNFTNDFGAGFYGEDTPVPGAAEHGYTAAPVIADQKLIACAGGTNGAGIVCFDKRTGKLIWKSQNDRASYAAPIVATLAGTRQAVCFTVEGLLGLALEDGALLWRVPIKTPYGRNCTTPVAIDDLVIVGSYRAGLLGIRVQPDGPRLKAEKAWVNKELSINFSSPVAAGRHLFGLASGKQLVCVEAATGHVAWAKKSYLASATEMAYASLLVMNENILVCMDDGQISLVGAEPLEFRELGRATICGPNWCSPAYADGRLYIRDGLKATGALYCFELTRAAHKK